MKNHEVVLEKRTTLAIFVLDFRTALSKLSKTAKRLQHRN